MAREWGKPPWELFGGLPLVWYLRYLARREAHTKAESMGEEERRRQAILAALG